MVVLFGSREVLFLLRMLARVIRRVYQDYDNRNIDDIGLHAGDVLFTSADCIPYYNNRLVYSM